MSPWELEKLWTFIVKNLKYKFIQPARPRVVVLVLFREKKDRSFHLCMDYGGLNAVCVENSYTLPFMKDMLTHLAKGKIFTKLCLWEAYY